MRPINRDDRDRIQPPSSRVPPALDDIDRVLRRLPHVRSPGLPKPEYQYGSTGPKLALAVASMREHMTDEGWQIMAGLAKNGYTLCGYGLPEARTNVKDLLCEYDPAVVVMQDKREWDVQPRNFRDPYARFHEVESLKYRPDVFKLTILKDAHQKPEYHRQSADEIGCHAWITYYATPIVKRLAPYVREQHLVRTYHTVDPAAVPAFSQEGRAGCLLSGAVSAAYPLRQALYANVSKLPETTALKHPGYHRNGSATPGFLQTLSKFKVALCTASMYGYALRKMIEATACGCVVVTNLPTDERLPYIDGNLVRIPSNASISHVAEVVRRSIAQYSPERQRHFAEVATYRYSYTHETERLSVLIDQLRSNY